MGAPTTTRSAAGTTSKSTGTPWTPWTQTFPGLLHDLARDGREFLRRGVQHLVGEAGIRQIVDIGCGLPTPTGNVHEIAHKIDPTVRVLYVDNDPLVLAHARALLATSDLTAVVEGDVRRPMAILDDPATKELLDLDQPYAVLLSSVLQHVPDADDPAAAVNTLAAAMPSGSYLLASNFLGDGDPHARAVERELQIAFGTCRFRSWPEQRRWFRGLTLVAPALVYLNDWRPDDVTEQDGVWHTFACAGIGQKL